MRQIKYRYYSDRENKCFPVEAIDFGTGPHKATVRFRIDGAAYQEDLDPKKLSQFTGLHDRNGKEIWEGDILEYYSGMVAKGENPMVRDVVRFVVQKGRPFSPEISGFTGLNGGEVIGNQYETPSLIQGETE